MSKSIFDEDENLPPSVAPDARRSDSGSSQNENSGEREPEESSNSGSESDESDEPRAKRIRSKNKEYQVFKLFDSKEDFDRWWAGEKAEWRVLERHENSSESVDFYRCKFGRRANTDCKVVLRVSYSAFEDEILIAKSRDEHDHSLLNEVALSEATKKTIKELTLAGLPPLRVLNNLRQQKVNPLPTLQQVQNQAKRARPDSGPTRFTDHDMRTYCAENSAVPEDEDQAYVIGHEVKSAESFAVCWSTKKLLEPEATRAMCWPHVSRCLDKRLLGIKDAAVRQSVRSDIHLLQYARSRQEFDQLADYMMERWPEDASEFSRYFRQTWIESNESNWFEGYATFVVNNSGLESHNRLIKQAHTLRKLLPMKPFMRIVGDMLNQWSVQCKAPVDGMSIPPHVFRSAYELKTSGRLWRKVTGMDRYIFASTDSKITSSEALAEAYDVVQALPSSFADYEKTRFKVYIVDRMDDKNFTCSCREGSKKRPCAHATMVMCLESVAIHSYPPDATADPINQRKKRGRPSQRKAVVQNRFAMAN